MLMKIQVLKDVTPYRMINTEVSKENITFLLLDCGKAVATEESFAVIHICS